MSNIGIFFGTDTGKTRKIAKMIHKKLGDAADAPLNINRTSLETFLTYPVLILGTPTLGDGQLPGIESGCESESWLEFAKQLAGADLRGKKVALFGLGDQVSYPDNFVNALGELYDLMQVGGATVVGSWPCEGYEFASSSALQEDDKFVGLVLDHDNQYDLTEARIDSWLGTLREDLL